MSHCYLLFSLPVLGCNFIGWRAWLRSGSLDSEPLDTEENLIATSLLLAVMFTVHPYFPAVQELDHGFTQSDATHMSMRQEEEDGHLCIWQCFWLFLGPNCLQNTVQFRDEYVQTTAKSTLYILQKRVLTLGNSCGGLLIFPTRLMTSCSYYLLQPLPSLTH